MQDILFFGSDELGLNSHHLFKGAFCVFQRGSIHVFKQRTFPMGLRVDPWYAKCAIFRRLFRHNAARRRGVFHSVFELRTRSFTLATVPTTIGRSVCLLRRVDPGLIYVQMDHVRGFISTNRFGFIVLFRLSVRGKPHLHRCPPRQKHDQATTTQNLHHLLFFLFNGKDEHGNYNIYHIGFVNICTVLRV